MECPNQECGAPNRLLARFCAVCGHPFPGAGTATELGRTDEPFYGDAGQATVVGLEKTWAKALNMGTLPYLLAVDGCVVALSGDERHKGRYQILDECDGRDRWLGGTVGDQVALPPMVADGYLLVPTDQDVRVVDLVSRVYESREGEDWGPVRHLGVLEAAGAWVEQNTLLTLVRQQSDPRTYHLVDVRRGAEKRLRRVVSEGGLTPIRHIAVSKHLALVGWTDGTLCLFDLRDDQTRKWHLKLDASLRWVAARGDGRFLAADEQNQLRDVFLEGEVLRCLPLLTHSSSRPSEVASNQWVTVAVRPEALSLLHENGRETPVPLRGIMVNREPLLRGRTGIVVSDDGLAYAVDVSSPNPRLRQVGRVLEPDDGGVTAVAATPRSVLISTRGGHVRRFLVRTG